MPGPTEICGLLQGQIQTPPKPTTSFVGRTVIITGGNSGLGFEAAKQMVQLNVSHLILGCRNLVKGEEAREKLVASSRATKLPTVEVWPIDMTNYDSVITFGKRIHTRHGLNAVILNAGAELFDFRLNEGIESTLVVNVISTFLLAELVLPKLRETADAQSSITHLTFVGSMIHIFGKTEQLRDAPRGEIFTVLSDPVQADMESRYPLSKLMLTLAHRAFVARVDASTKGGLPRVIINDVNPGWCKTELFRNEEPSFASQMALRMMGRTAEAGGRTLTHAASAGRETHGKYLSECQVKPESKFVRSKAGLQIQEKLGNELRNILEDIQPGVTEHS